MGHRQPMSNPKPYPPEMNLNSDRSSSVAAVLNPHELPAEKLFYWMMSAKNPVLASDDPIVRMFLAAAIKGERVNFFYLAGSEPGKLRTVSPASVFQHDPEGVIYVAGYCHQRQANRVFRLDRVLSEWVVN